MNHTCTKLGTKYRYSSEDMTSHSNWLLPCYGIREENFHFPAEILERLHKTVSPIYCAILFFGKHNILARK